MNKDWKKRLIELMYPIPDRDLASDDDRVWDYFTLGQLKQFIHSVRDEAIRERDERWRDEVENRLATIKWGWDKNEDKLLLVITQIHKLLASLQPKGEE